MSYEQVLEDIRRAVSEPEDTAEIQIERRMDFVLRELDEFAKMASHGETVDLIDGQKVAVGQMVRAVRLIAGFLIARQPQPFRKNSRAA